MILQDNSTFKRYIRTFFLSFGLCIILGVILFTVKAGAVPGISIDLTGTQNADNGFGPIEILFLFTILALAPSLLIMMTSFTRIIIVLSFLRNALGTQQSPPNQVLVGLALFMTLFIMFPVFSEINELALDPYNNGEITQQQAFSNAAVPIKTFMLKQTDKKSLDLFLSISKTELPDGFISSQQDFTKLGLEIIVPSFMTSELKRAFTMGFLIFLPFLIIDIVVSSTLMSMGMIMLPPATIALPFKILTFILVDGWGLIMATLAQSFR